MANSVNKVTLVGRLGTDPDIRDLGGEGDRVANLSVGTSESWKNKETDQWQERTQWHKVAIFNQALVEVVGRKLHKGSKVLIEGQLENRSWEDRDGGKHYVTEVVIRPFKGDLQVLDAPAARPENGAKNRKGNQPAPRPAG